MEYIAVLNNYLEYGLDEKTWYGFHLSSFFESYWRKPRLNFFFSFNDCIFTCTFIFVR